MSSRKWQHVANQRVAYLIDRPLCFILLSDVTAVKPNYRERAAPSRFHFPAIQKGLCEGPFSWTRDRVLVRTKVGGLGDFFKVVEKGGDLICKRQIGQMTSFVTWFRCNLGHPNPHEGLESLRGPYKFLAGVYIALERFPRMRLEKPWIASVCAESKRGL